MTATINFARKFEHFSDRCQPKIHLRFVVGRGARPRVAR